MTPKVAAGGYHTLAISQDGSLWAWGGNQYGQLGLGTGGDGRDTSLLPKPTRVGQDTNWVVVGAGEAHTVAIKDDGTLWAWGANWHGQLGLGTNVVVGFQNSATINGPTKIGQDNDWMAVAAGRYHTVALKKDGTLWAWGLNDWGQVGDRSGGFIADLNYPPVISPVRVGSDRDWVAVDAAEFFSVALKADHSLWAWGRNSFGQLGDGTGEAKISPARVDQANDWAAIFAGGINGAHLTVLKLDGSLWSCGYNWAGQVGDGTGGHNRHAEDRFVLVRIGQDNDWLAASGGGRHTVAIKKSGSLWAWGSSANDQLGDGSHEVQVSSPIRCGAGTNWVAVDAGFYHTVALASEGSIWTWGDNYWGQLGNGRGKTSRVPVRVGNGPSNFYIPLIALLCLSSLLLLHSLRLFARRVSKRRKAGTCIDGFVRPPG